MNHKSSSFELLNSKVQKWIWNQGWTSLKEIQENSIPVILKGDSDVIISAETAGGKTEAVFLPILSKIEEFNEHNCNVIYISPLKALINDQYRRLLDMTNDLSVKVTPWHGDVNQSTKSKWIKEPTGILIITPESLESFLINKHSKIKVLFSKVMYIVVDEFHSFIGNERGKQLQSLLSRIESITNRIIPRVAMSATFSNYESVKDFLRPDKKLKCIIPSRGESKQNVRLVIKAYSNSYNEDSDNVVHNDISEDISNEIFTKLRGSNNLVFTNSRSEAEFYSFLLRKKCEDLGVPNEFRVHHGSLSKVERESVEKELQIGSVPITAFCTSTLELGVDIGKVKSIAQIGVVSSVSGLKQRLGRSGRRNEPAELRVFSIEKGTGDILSDLRTNLVQNIAVIELLLEHKYESYNINNYHLSTLIQQILSVIASYGSFYPEEGWKLLCKNGAFKNITPKLFLSVLKSLGQKKVVSQLNNGQIIIGKEGEYILSDLNFYIAFISFQNFSVIDNASSKKIGEIGIVPNINDTLLLASRQWEVINIDKKRKIIYVEATNYSGSVYFNVNDGIDVDRIITRKMKEIYSTNNTYLYLDKKTNAQHELDIARSVYCNNGLENNSIINYKDISDDDSDEISIIFTWEGTKVNRTISLLNEYFSGRKTKYNELVIIGISEEDIHNILSNKKPSGEELASLLRREDKEKQKYDYLLSNQLLNIEYGNTYIDVENAWDYLSSIV